MVLLVELLHADVGIDLGGIDARMAKHLLDHQKIRPIVEKVGRERVAQFMGMKPKIQARFLVDDFENVF